MKTFKNLVYEIKSGSKTPGDSLTISSRNRDQMQKSMEHHRKLYRSHVETTGKEDHEHPSYKNYVAATEKFKQADIAHTKERWKNNPEKRKKELADFHDIHEAWDPSYTNKETDVHPKFGPDHPYHTRERAINHLSKIAKERKKQGGFRKKFESEIRSAKKGEWSKHVDAAHDWVLSREK